MTAKRESKPKPKKAERPKIQKETLKDLEERGGDRVKGGARIADSERQGCSL